MINPDIKKFIQIIGVHENVEQRMWTDMYKDTGTSSAPEKYEKDVKPHKWMQIKTMKFFTHCTGEKKKIIKV